MSDILNEQGSGVNPLKEGEVGSSELMLREATLLADFLSKGSDKVIKVGIGGSLSRGKKNPGDIDLVIFVDDQMAQRFFNDTFDRRVKGEKVDIKEELAKLLGLSGEMKTLWEMTLEQVASPVDFLLVPDDPSEKSTHLWAQYSLDPSFLENIAKNARIYHPEVNGFVQEEIYSPDQIERIRKASFVRLKEIHLNEETGLGEDLNKMETSHSHQKRIKRVKIQSLTPNK